MTDTTRDPEQTFAEAFAAIEISLYDLRLAIYWSTWAPLRPVVRRVLKLGKDLGP